MAFVFRTRLVRFADLVNGTPTPRAPQDETVLITGPIGTVVETVEAAMALVPAQQRPPESEWFLHRIEWRVQSNVVPHIRGVVTGTGRLVFDVDMWDTEAARLAAPSAPQRRETFIYEFTSKRLAGARQEIRAAIDDFLLRAQFANPPYPVDGRDPRYSTTATDPMFLLVTGGAGDRLGLMGRAAITDADGVPDDLPARWRDASG